MTLQKTKKRRAPSYQRKMSGSHHRKNDKYLKTYWPYIPIVLILFGSVAFTGLNPRSTNISGGIYHSRLEAAVGVNSKLLLIAGYMVLVAAVIWFIVRHFKQLRKLLLDGEKWLIKNYVLDVLLAVLIAGLYILVR